MTPDKLREKGNRWRELGQYDLANIYNQHAAALEEIERLKELESYLTDCANGWKERAEQAERRAERLKDYAEVAMSWIEDKHPDEAKQYLPDFVDAYRADKGE